MAEFTHLRQSSSAPNQSYGVCRPEHGGLTFLLLPSPQKHLKIVSDRMIRGKREVIPSSFMSAGILLSRKKRALLRPHNGDIVVFGIFEVLRKKQKKSKQQGDSQPVCALYGWFVSARSRRTTCLDATVLLK